MMRFLPLAVLVALAGCADKSAPAPTPPVSPPPAPAPAPVPVVPLPAPPAPPEPEPSKITVQHVLIAFEGAKMAENVTRTREEAKKLALEVLERAKKGEDIEALSKEYSTDPGGGKYTLVNTGVAPKGDEIPRKQFIKPFVDVAFKLKVGGVGLVEYEPKAAPFGWHVIKRLE